MKLTKFQHACFVIEKDGANLVVDPGEYSRDFIVPHNVVAVVITHEHADHLSEKHMQDILQANPKATIIAHESIVGRYTNYAALAAKPGVEPIAVGPFALRFFGGTHLPVSETAQMPPNLGVLIDDALYYPGDSFVVPEGIQVNTLALPASAPWMKMSDAMSFLTQIKPSLAFPTHDAILSDDGKGLADFWLGGVAAAQNTLYKRLDGSTIELV